MEARRSLTPSPDRKSAEAREHADHEGPGVGAQLARLKSRADPSDEARKIGAAVHGQSVDEPNVDSAPEQTARDAVCRPDKRGVIGFVDVILVGQYALDTRLLGCARLRDELRRLQAIE